MTKRAVAGGVALLLCLVCCTASSQERFKGKGKRKIDGRPAPAEAYSGPRWEYQILSRPEIAKLGGGELRSGLNKLGEEGWELAGLEPTPGSGELYFKRPRRAAQAPAGSPAAAAEANDVTRVIRLKHAAATEMIQTLAQLYRERGVRLAVDQRTNSVIVAGAEERLMDLLKLAAELDGPEEARKEEARRRGRGEGR